MAEPRTAHTKNELLTRFRELEFQLESQESLQDLIVSLHTHQEELRTQQDALVHAQSELEASRDRYAELYDFSPVPIVSLRTNGVLEGMNLAAARLLGVDRAGAIGTPLLVFVQEASRRAFLDHMLRLRREDGLVRSQLSVRGADGQEVPVEVQSRRFEPSQGAEVVVYQTALIDMSERRRHEEDLRHADEERARNQRDELAARAASEAKDRFLAVLSHELRTPLTPILLMLETLEDEQEGANSSHQRSLAAIRRNTELMARLIDDLLDVTRIVHDKLHLSLAPVALHPLLRSVVDMCDTDLEQRKIQVDLELDPGNPYVLGDALRLRQVFWNLLRNAIQHSPDGARVEIHCGMPATGKLRVSVRDNGKGLDPEDMERIFEPFQQSGKNLRQGAGLGLGLAICRGLAEAHGGTIYAGNAGFGSGALFTVELPLCPAPKSLPRGPQEQPIRRAALRILVVEDHADTADAMQLVLTRMGYRVRVATSLGEGRELAQEPFDVLISDVQLPDGSGLDLMRELSAQHAVKGIAMSGFGTEDDARRSREAGFQTHLVKPVDVHRVAEAIDELAGG
jgi:PAS domain S-box-containing protein